LKTKGRQMRMYLVPHFGSIRLDAMTEFSVETYKRRRKEQGASNGTINRELTTLSQLFYLAVDWKWIEKLPLRIGKHLLPESEGRIVALNDAECSALMESALASNHPDLWLFVAFGLNTAMRHGEILDARWENLDLANRRLFIPRAKAGPREQPITAELARILEQERAGREDQQGWIFPSPHRDTAGGRRGNLRRPFYKAVAAAGLDPTVVTPHCMRHTAITKLVQAGVDLPTIQRISGHKTMGLVLRSRTFTARISTGVSRRWGATCRRRMGAGTTRERITQELHIRLPRRRREEQNRAEFPNNFKWSREDRNWMFQNWSRRSSPPYRASAGSS
jgi:integrase